ncbi:prosaposin [Hippoglossus stenolepis]|uniref:prosaposin n=1 Tax=Hippoglossus stenolepis TaxID=195615 RepID=UPI00159C2CA7|nr:prosaposin [Hippoglossus stenolepis]XP_034997680.1 prosaposin [Hippoglossus stenolepis]
MAALQFMLFLYIGLQSFALNAGALQRVPDAWTATGDVCKDCTQIFELLEDLLSSADLQKKVIDGLETLCDHLPGPPSVAILCRKEVERMLPLAITLITGFVKPVEVCKLIGLCGSSRDKQKMLSYFAEQALQAAVTSQDGRPTSACSFCLFLLKTLEDLLPKERTEAEVVRLLEEICHILPASYHDQCEAFIDRFGKTVLDAITRFATPRAVCSLLHQCEWQDAAVAVSDPCTVTTYRCRDVSTALRCGTLFYCQRFAWKPLDSNTL